jgi:hypothetical protein
MYRACFHRAAVYGRCRGSCTLNGAGDEKVKQDLESLSRHVPQRPFEHLGAAHEKAAQRVGNLGLADKVCETRRDPLIRMRPLLKSPKPPPGT